MNVFGVLAVFYGPVFMSLGLIALVFGAFYFLECLEDRKSLRDETRRRCRHLACGRSPAESA